MVSKSFDINTANLLPFEPGTRSLLLEISPTAVSVILWDKEKKAPEAFEVFNGIFLNAADWELISQQSRLLGLTHLETQVIHSFETMLPMPLHLYTPQGAQEQMQLLFGAKMGMHASADILADHEMALAWQLPADVYQQIAAHFKVFQVRHVGADMVQDMHDTDDAHGKVVLYGSQCWISLWNKRQLQLIKSVAISQPDDLSWHLLNICRQFDLEPAAISWEVAGMAEQNSPLWNAITRFFEPVQPMASYVALPEDMPAHYFAHLYKGMR